METSRRNSWWMNRGWIAGLSFFFFQSVIFAGLAWAQVTEEWVAEYNGPGNSSDYALALTVDADMNVYVTGHPEFIAIGIILDRTKVSGGV